MSESLSWMQTGDTLALSGELDQDVLLPLWCKTCSRNENDD